MKVVLERLRTGGLVAVFEGMRHDREAMATGIGESALSLISHGRDDNGKR